MTDATVQPIGVEFGHAYEIVGPDGTRAVFNDATDPDFVGFLTGDDAVTGLERAAVRENAEDLPEADGGVHGNFLYGRLAFTLKGIIPAEHGTESWIARQSRLMRATDAMRGDAVLRWTPSEADPVQVAFRQQQATRITGRRPKSFLVAGVSEDPVVYSQTLHIEQIDAPAGSTAGGVRFPLTFPLVFEADPIAQATVLNAGNKETWPVFEIFGPAIDPWLMHVESGRKLQFLWELAAGERLVIDTNPRRRTIRLDGTTNRYRALDRSTSAWWPLEPGLNGVRLGFATYSEDAYATVAWRDAHG